MQKEKRKNLLRKVIAWAVLAAIVIGVGGAVGVSLYNSHKAKLASMPTYSTTSFTLNDYAGLRAAAEAEHEHVHEDEGENEPAEEAIATENADEIAGESEAVPAVNAEDIATEAGTDAE